MALLIMVSKAGRHVFMDYCIENNAKEKLLISTFSFRLKINIFSMELCENFTWNDVINQVSGK